MDTERGSRNLQKGSKNTPRGSVSEKFPFQNKIVRNQTSALVGGQQVKTKSRRGNQLTSGNGQKLNFMGQVPADTLEINPAYAIRMLRSLRFQTDLYTTTQMVDIVATTDGSGNLATVIGSTPGTTANWAAIASVFDEYRILALDVEFEPLVVVGSAVNFASIATVIDYDTSTALSSYTIAMQYSSCQEFGGNRRFQRLAVMSGAENSTFLTTASPVSSFWIKVWSSGGTINTTIGRYKVAYLIQFRGKGI